MRSSTPCQSDFLMVVYIYEHTGTKCRVKIQYCQIRVQHHNPHAPELISKRIMHIIYTLIKIKNKLNLNKNKNEKND